MDEAATLATLQKRWRDVLNASPGDRQFSLLPVLLANFENECPHSEAIAFKNVFDDGVKLAMVLCKCLASVISSALHSLNERKDVLSLMKSASYSRVVSVLHIMGTQSFYNTSVVQTSRFGKVLGAVAAYHIPLLLVQVHGVAVRSMLDSGGEKIDVCLLSADVKTMNAVRHYMTCSEHAPSLLSDMRQSMVLRTVIGTFEITLSNHLDSGVELSENLLTIVQLILKDGAKSVPLCEDQTDVAEDIIFQRALLAAHSTLHSLEEQSGRLHSLVSCMECLICIRNVFGYPENETIDFGALLSTILSLQEPMALCKEVVMRLFKCIEVLATAIRGNKSGGNPTQSRKNVVGFFSTVLPSQLSKIQRLVGSVGAGVFPESSRVNPITCREAVECIVGFFVCASTATAVDACGDSLFRLISMDGVDNELTLFVLNSCIENLLSLRIHQINRVLELLQASSQHMDISLLVVSLVKALNERSKADVEVKVAVLDFLSLYVAKSKYTADTCFLHDALQWTLLELASIHDWKEPLVFTHISSAARLFQSALVSSSFVLVLDKIEGPRHILDILLRAHASGCIEVVTVLKKLFFSMVRMTSRRVAVLMGELVEKSAHDPWLPQTTVLLRLFVSVLQNEKCAIAAIKGNGVYLCLSLLRGAKQSTQFETDVHLIGSSLALMLKYLRWSEAGSVVASVVVPLRTPWMIQLLTDICCGYYGSSRNLALVSDLGANAVIPDRSCCTEVRQFFVPVFCRFEHPFIFGVFAQWMSELKSEPGGLAAELKELLAVLGKRYGMPINDKQFTSFVTKQGLCSLLSYVADVAGEEVLGVLFPPQRNYTLEHLRKIQDAWLPVTVEKYHNTGDEFHDFIEMLEDSGVQGVLHAGSSRLSPSEGYTVALWVFWDECEGKDICPVLPLWELRWPENGKTSLVSLSIETLRRRSALTFSLTGEAPEVVALPFIKPGDWKHVSISYQCGKLFSSRFKVFFDGVCIFTHDVAAGPAALVTPSTTAAIVAGILSDNCQELFCTVGVPRGNSAEGCKLRLLSFYVFGAALDDEVILSLYCASPQSLKGCCSGIRGALESTLLKSEMLRYISASERSGTLGSLVNSKIIRIAPFPEASLLLSLYARAVVLVDAPLLQSLDNKKWVLRNGVLKGDLSHFELYGTHSEPLGAGSSVPTTLISHGAPHEWMRWFVAITDLYYTLKVDNDNTNMQILQGVAVSTLKIIATCFSAVTGIADIRLTMFASQVMSQVIRLPRVYLGTEEGMKAFLSMCVTEMPGSGNLFLFHTAPMEHVLFNWKIVSCLPQSSQKCILFHFDALLRPSNPFRVVNALRLRYCDFFNGFLCGLVREYLPVHLLMSAIDVVAQYMQCLSDNTAALGDILALCASTVPVEQDFGVVSGRLVSKLPLVGFEHIVLVRNLLLKVLCDACTVSLSGDGEKFVESLSSVVPRCWFHTMTNRWSHPVSVSMSLRLFVVCYLRKLHFRQRFGDMILLLCDNLRHHSHQVDVSSVLLHGFMGHEWKMQEWPQHLVHPSLAIDTSAAVPSLLSLLMELIGRNAVLLLHREPVVNYAGVTCSLYYAAVKARAKCVSQSSPWRRSCIVVAFCIRLRSPQRMAPRAASTGLFSERALINVDDVGKLVASVVRWIAENYMQYTVLSKTLYLSQQVCNPIDFVFLLLFITSGMDGPLENQEGLFATSEVYDVHASTGDEGDDEEEEEEEVKTGSTDDGYDAVAVLGDAADAFENMGPHNCDVDILLPIARKQLYDVCRILFFAHIRRYAFTLKTQGERRGNKIEMVSKLVFALHRAFAVLPHGVGNTAESAYCATVCRLWLKALTNIVNGSSHGEATECVLKNMVAVAQYLISRLKSGAAIPPAAVMNFIRFLLEKCSGIEHTKLLQHLISEWLICIMAPSFYQEGESKAAAVIELMYDSRNIIFTLPISSAELLGFVVMRLLDVSETFLSAESALTSETAARLAEVWQTLISVNKGSPAFQSVLTRKGCVDLQGGFHLLASPDSDRVKFLVWLFERRGDVQSRLRTVQCTYHTAEWNMQRRKYLRWIRHSISEHRHERFKFLKACQEMCSATHLNWKQFNDTSTFVDPALLTHRSVCGEPTRQQQMLPQGGGVAGEPQALCLHPSGAIGYTCFCTCEDLNDLGGHHMSLYVRYSPLACLPMRSTLQDTVSLECGLRVQAAAVLHRILDPVPYHSILFVGNVYYLVGNECLICVLLVTNGEVVIMNNSEVTTDGDIVIAQRRRYTKVKRSSMKSTLVHDAIRRILPVRFGEAVTNTKAAFRYSQYFRLMCSESSLQSSPTRIWRFFLGNVQTLHQRLFQHMPTALEFELENGDRYFVVALDDELSFSKTAREKLRSIISSVAPHVEVETSSLKESRLAGLTKRWIRHEISNRQYLLCVNDAAGRTVADISQYPVMPWVLNDYRSPTIDLGNAGIYRDLAKPVGALKPVKAAQLRARYEEWLDATQPPFHHGTHYSSSAIVMYYLIRLQPFTQWSKRYQGGKLDIADRLFHSIAEAWESCSGAGDVKELIPEFFSSCEIFLNKNQTELGTRCDSIKLGDVILPEWSRGSVEKFLHLHVLALESDAVSEKLHNWIDLVFGCKQRGQEAVGALNVFHHLSYKQGVERAISQASDDDARKAIVASAASFGQTPKQLFTASHAKRLQATAVVSKQEYFMANVKQLSRRRQPVYFPWENIDNSAPIMSLSVVNSCIAASTQYCLFLPTSPLQMCVYNQITKELFCHCFQEPTLVCALPGVARYGRGEPTAICTSTKGGILCLGTNKGVVFVFSRGSATGPFCVSMLLHVSNGDERKAVNMLKMWRSGHLAVVCGENPFVSVWHVSHSNAMLCFSICIRDIVSEPGGVQNIARDEQRKHYFIATEYHLLQLSSDGTVLTLVDVRSRISKLTQRSGNPGPCVEGVVSPMRSVEYLNFESHSNANILLAGHGNGTLCFWAVEAVKAVESASLYTIRNFYSSVVDTDSAITAIMWDGECIAAGTEKGEVHSLTIPIFSESQTEVW
ncbi:WD repeat and FYVE domain-containing protein 3-like [Trypanosoma grayi]|uniref:WD repeat and FYVE domain-containing protein 3-like n=1 Tax=Trypanosoma grayi TaxID=71804 RepID=UPI0004F41252|nr:WD repeat and FYVE domain-containing protein 3-like [Trypanosoma grayi]KEG11190.1 WD repeat and FYVE domain-containing protein 3-like [Trypanosoma grayi]